MDALILQCKLGDIDAFNRLIEDYKDIALKMAIQLTGSIHEAEDIIQEAFIKVYKHIKNFNGECSFTTWLYQIILNLYRDSCKKANKLSTISMEKIYDKIMNIQCPSLDFELKEIRESISQNINNLPDLTQKAILLKDYYGFSYQEISNMLECSIDSVKTRLYRGRKFLQENFNWN